MTLETIHAELLSDHSNLQPTSLGWVYNPTQSLLLISNLVSMHVYNYTTHLMRFSEFLYTYLVVASPLNVQASQSSASAPVEVSWSPPSGGAATITGYRIFYGNGKKVLVTSTDVTSVGLVFNKDAVGQTVSIHSVADQLTSKLINVTITGKMRTCHTQLTLSIPPP